MSKARTLANLISDNAELADGQISVAEVVGAAPTANPTFTGNVDVSGNLTSDGLSVSNSGNLTALLDSTSGTPKLQFRSSGGSLSSYIQHGVGGTANLSFQTNGTTERMSIEPNGDVLLYEDTGSTPALTWDASAQSLNVDGPITSNALDLDAIAKDISDTAVDVFVYDTSKDSDGGAWRKRTQGTSWYNETLNTSTRGSRREFPAVAVIVAESNQVTIYDGDDPDLPMWMVFNINGTNNFLLTGVGSITSINGKIALGNTGSYARLMLVDFLAEESYWITSSSVTVKQQGIASRNSTTSNVTSSNYGTIVHSTVNDVAMTVLPNAPIDAATGLPVPTIAVATDGGVSVIKDDGTVVDSGVTFGHTHVAFKGSTFYYASTSSGGTARRVDNVASLADGFTPDKEYNYGQVPYITQKTDGYNSTSHPTPMEGNVIASYSNYGVHSAFVITDPDMNASTAGTTDLLARIQKDYNTGWMNGDIKLATLSDTDDTDVTGSELVTNGTFDSNTTGWTGFVSTLSVVSNALRITLTGNNGWAEQSITTVVGETYTISFDLNAKSTTNFWVDVGTTSNADSGRIFREVITTTGSKAVTFEATSTTTYVFLRPNGGSSSTADVDNVSVRLAEEDRSVNGNGLQVFGTVTKTPVATGADLVAYSGFSASNYLQQPYNSDMDIDADDDVCVITWAKLGTANNYIFDRTDDANTGSRYFAYRRGGADDKLVFMGLQSSTAFSDDFAAGWHQYTLLRRSGTIEIWVDGRLDATGADTQDRTNTSAKLTIGNNYTTGANNAASALALFRFSATAPTPEQIKRIYEDEKVLFQEGAQATLYAASPASGSPDLVKALAYDDSTELLHVGTNNGRSVFQGLRRVSNTTNAVGAAISASNGMIVEE